MNEKMNCDVIRDLIPLCAEGLCSEESRALIESHVETCGECRRLYTKIPSEPEREIAVPEEGKALRKVNRRLRRGKAWLILLLIVLLGLLYLTVGQIVKRGPIQSFETIWRTAEVYPLARMLANGDFDRYAPYMTTGETYNYYAYKSFEEIRTQDIEDLTAAFQAAYGGARVKRIKVHSYYEELRDGAPKTVLSEISIRYDDGRVLEFEGGKDIEGLYCFDVITFSGQEETMNASKDFEDAMYHANYHGSKSLFVREVLFTTDMLRESPNPEGRMELIANRFREEYRESVTGSINAFLDAGYVTTACTLSHPRYDEERGGFYYAFTLTGRDGEGTALMAGRMYFDYKGIYPPDPADVTVYANGCGEELPGALLHFFG